MRCVIGCCLLVASSIGFGVQVSDYQKEVSAPVTERATTCTPSPIPLPVEFEAPPDGVAGVEYDTGTGRITSMTFFNAPNVNAQVRSGAVKKVTFNSDNEVLDVIPITPDPSAVGCNTTIVVTPETTTIKCEVNGCVSHCAIYTDVVPGQPVQRYCGCNRNPTPTPTPTPVTPSPTPAPPTPNPSPN